MPAYFSIFDSLDQTQSNVLSVGDSAILILSQSSLSPLEDVPLKEHTTDPIAPVITKILTITGSLLPFLFLPCQITFFWWWCAVPSKQWVYNFEHSCSPVLVRVVMFKNLRLCAKSDKRNSSKSLQIHFFNLGIKISSPRLLLPLRCSVLVSHRSDYFIP